MNAQTLVGSCICLAFFLFSIFRHYEFCVCINMDYNSRPKTAGNRHGSGFA